jgi:DNA-directed RNA polymerase specialized sigma24 family protein
VDDVEYGRIRQRMRLSVLRVWRSDRVVAGMDPWDVVDEAWRSMAESGFASAGPFDVFALRVAKNKALDLLYRAEARRQDRSLHEPLSAGTDGSLVLADVLPGSQGADEEYFASVEHRAAIEELALVEEAIDQVLAPVERQVFLAVVRDRKSRAAVGRDLDQPVTGQRVGQIVAAATSKIRAYVDEHPRRVDERV